jgi:murein DD-endopeptidase MepM/ murein hydrolase activator NlpD
LAALVVAASPLEAQVARPGMAPPSPPGAHVRPLPDPSGWGTHVLALARGPDGSIWAGTYGEGIYVLRSGATEWENIRHDPGSAQSISWNFVHAIAFGRGRDVWYGTIGNGFGVSRDGGRTWRNWQFRDLGPRWLYVAPNGIVTRGDTVFIATADGLRWTTDRGASWTEVDELSLRGPPSRYLLTVAAARGGGLWVSSLRGLGTWRVDNGYRPVNPSPAGPLGPRIRAVHVIEAPAAVVPAVLGSERCPGGLRPRRRQDPATWQCMGSLMQGMPPTGRAVRQMAGCDGVLCALATSHGAIFGARLGLAAQPAEGTARSHDVYAALTPSRQNPGDTLFGTACGLLGSQSEACLRDGDTTGVPAPEAPRHVWFARPISLADQPYIDQTYRFGSTMGGNFQPHQGVEFNNPGGTPVLAVDAGVVVHAGSAEQGSLTIAIRHDSTLTAAVGGATFTLFSTYYHNSRLLVRVGERVQRGQRIALVGSTGRATNDHLHLEIHVSPTDDVGVIVNENERFPPHARNPELWIEPLPGTGLVAGQVWDSLGRPVRQTRVYGLVKPEPQETPFSFAETYGERNSSDPSYGEHFAVSDVPPGEYVLGVEIGGTRLFKRIRVEAGMLSWVEFRP